MKNFICQNYDNFCVRLSVRMLSGTYQEPVKQENKVAISNGLDVIQAYHKHSSFNLNWLTPAVSPA